MNETRDLGRLYVVRYDHCVKQFERAESRMAEPPFRVGKGVAIRLWRHRGFVVGWWGPKAKDEDEGLYRSLAAREMEASTEEIERWGGMEAYR